MRRTSHTLARSSRGPIDRSSTSTLTPGDAASAPSDPDAGMPDRVSRSPLHTQVVPRRVARNHPPRSTSRMRRPCRRRPRGSARLPTAPGIGRRRGMSPRSRRARPRGWVDCRCSNGGCRTPAPASSRPRSRSEGPRNQRAARCCSTADPGRHRAPPGRDHRRELDRLTVRVQVGSGVAGGCAVGAVECCAAGLVGTLVAGAALAGASIDGRGREPAPSPLSSAIATISTIARVARPVPMPVEIVMTGRRSRPPIVAALAYRSTATRACSGPPRAAS